MTITVSHTLLAYLLALKDYSASLSPKDRENLQAFSREFRLYPNELENYIEPLLRDKIAENDQLNQLFQTYQKKLSQHTDIPSNLLPDSANFNQLKQPLNSDLMSKSSIPNIPDDTTPEGQAEILNNSVILISQSEQPEKSANQLDWVNKLKQWLG